MTTIREKKEAIIAFEQRLAHAVSREVIEKPKLSVWMILIPIFFVFFAYRMNRYKKGREVFADNFLVTPGRALEVAAEAVIAGKSPDIEVVVRQTSSPPDTLDAYRKWVAALTGHYLELLSADGRDCETLIKKVYGKRANYLLFCNQLNSLEKAFNVTLKPHLKKTTDDVGDIVTVMEKAAAKHRRKLAGTIFSSS